MRFLSRLGDAESRAHKIRSPVSYESVANIESKAVPGVKFVIHRMSFGRRMELSRRIREISRRVEFLAAGDQLQEKIEANILAQEIDAMYVHWGLVSIDGLAIDGDAATGAHLLEKGPEALMQEIVRAIKEQCGLGEAERKN
jgi:hypothetical protein